MRLNENELPKMLPVGKAKNLEGQRFGKLVVKYRCEYPEGVPHTSAYWVALCDCGYYTQVRGSHLTDGRIKSCGHPDCNNPAEDLIGKTFGRLTVLNREPNQGKKIMWRCRCSCEEHNEVIVAGQHLKDGHTRSCGCLNKKQIREMNAARTTEDRMRDITGMTSGTLTAIEYTGKHMPNSNHTIWRCKCSACGRDDIEIPGYYITEGRIKSCGCIKSGNESYGERVIRELLEKNNISFKQEYKFEDFIYSDTGRQPRYDFYVENKYCIEYDGEDHFMIISRSGDWSEAEEKYNKRTEKDKIKNQYCFDNNIALIRIPYTHLNNITLADLLPATSQFLLKATE